MEGTELITVRWRQRMFSHVTLDLSSVISGFVRSKLRDRSVSVLVGMGQMFRSMDVSGDGMLSKSELAEALESFDIKLPEKVGVGSVLWVDTWSIWRQSACLAMRLIGNVKVVECFRQCVVFFGTDCLIFSLTCCKNVRIFFPCICR